VGPKTIEKLEAAGITSVEKLADMTPEQLVEIPGIGEKMVEKIHQSVAAYFEALESQAVAPVEPSTEDEAAAESVAPEAAAAATEAVETAAASETSGSEASSSEASSSEASASSEETPEDEETTPADKAAAAAVDESAEKLETSE
jgi:N utilization substance protein A